MATPEEQIPAEEPQEPEAETPTEAEGGEVEAEPSAEDAGAAAPQQPTVLNHPDLPEELRGKTPKELNDLWSLTRQALSAQEYARRVQESQQAPAAPEPPPDPFEGTTFADALMEDPEKALDAWVQQKYGPVLETQAENALEGIYASMRTDPTFEKYESEVRKIIDGLGVPKSQIRRQHVDMALDMAVGKKTRQEVSKPTPKQETTPEAPTPKPSTPQGPKLNDVQKEIAHRLFPRSEDPEADYAKWLQNPNPQMPVATKVKRTHGRDEEG